jgi:hypothetical protein
VKNSEDKKKINYALANLDEFKTLQQTKWIEGRAAATEWRTCREPVMDRDSKLEKHQFVSPVISKKWQEQLLHFLKIQVVQE